MIDKQDAIVSLLKEIDKNVENLGVGGGNTPTSISGGYPVVTVEDDFNINAEPNTFYNIKNDAESEINITFGNDYFIDKISKHLMFTGDLVGDEWLNEFLLYFLYFGGKVYKDSSKEGYTHRLDILSGDMLVSFYFSDEIKTGNNVLVLVDGNSIEEGLGDIMFELNNIIVLNEGINYLVYVTISEGGPMPHCLSEVSNDNSLFNYKYNIIGAAAMSGMTTIYTNEPYYNTSHFYLPDGTDLLSVLGEILIVSNVETTGSDVTNEFVFNINSPANIIFTQKVKWHNDNIPDLTEEGVYTISIVNGVGCYTFVTN